MKDSVRVLLADDHAVLRAGLRALLNAEPDIEVVGEAADGAEAVKQVEALCPDLVVMDLAMPGMSGLEAIEQIATRFLDTKILVLTMHAEKQYVLRVIKAGGSGYVLKSAADTELIEAIRQIHAGKAYLYPDAAQVLLEHYQRDETEEVEEGVAADSLDLLSPREREVLQLTALGYSSREIGTQLHISPKTVDTYRQRLMNKLDLHHRVDLLQYALSRGLIKIQLHA